jgi:hypothetical protein
MRKVVSLNERKKSEKIRFELVETNIHTRWRCHICGGCMEKGPILCAVKEGPHKGLRICEGCLRAGRKKVNERLERQIKSLEEEISELKSIAGRLDFPTYNEWQAAYKEHERKFLEESEKGN